MAGRPGNITHTNIKNMDSSKIIWSPRAFPLRFQKDLPKVVQVEDGFYSDNEDTTVSSDDVLTLHCRKTLRSYRAVGKLGQEIYIPTSMAAKIETVPTKPARIYQKVEELVENGIERVQWMHATPWLKINEGDVLELHEVDDDRATKAVRMSFVDKPQDDIFVPLSYSSKFKEINKRCLWLGPGFESQLSYPITIKIVDDTLKLNTDQNKTSNLSTLADLGQVTLLGIHETEVFIASIKDEDNRIGIMKIPTNLDITVRGGLGMVGGEDDDNDYTYANVCEMFNKRAKLENLDEDIYDCVRIGGVNTAVERIYEVAIDSDSDDDCHDYIEPAPAIPTRIGREPLQPQQQLTNNGYEEEEEESDSDIDYEPVEFNESEGTNEERTDTKRGTVQHAQIIDPNSDKIQRRKRCNCCCCFRNIFRRKSQTSTFQILQATHPVCSPTARAPNATPLRYVDDHVIRGEPIPGEIRDFKIPDNLGGLSIEEVSECLRLLNMPQHIEKFQQNQIDGRLLEELDESMLVELGVSHRFEKTKLMSFIHNGWRPQLKAQ